MSDEEVRAWLEASCAEQGVPVEVTNPRVLEQVRVLFTGHARTDRAHRP